MKKLTVSVNRKVYENFEINKDTKESHKIPVESSLKGVFTKDAALIDYRHQLAQIIRWRRERRRSFALTRPHDVFFSLTDINSLRLGELVELDINELVPCNGVGHWRNITPEAGCRNAKRLEHIGTSALVMCRGLQNLRFANGINGCIAEFSMNERQVHVVYNYFHETENAMLSDARFCGLEKDEFMAALDLLNKNPLLCACCT